MPSQANLAVQESKHERANKNLEEAEGLLRAKDEELKVVQDEYDAIMRERQVSRNGFISVEGKISFIYHFASCHLFYRTEFIKVCGVILQVIVDELDSCQQKMDTATAMIDGLSGERVRWTKQLETFKSETDRLVGDVLVLTGFLSYCGPFNQEFRLNMEKTWFDMIEKRKIPLSTIVNIVESLSDSATVIFFADRLNFLCCRFFYYKLNYLLALVGFQIGEWNLQGLPNDELSIQNGIIVTKASRYPVLIDPQLQGKVWIKNKEKDFELQVNLYLLRCLQT